MISRVVEFLWMLAFWFLLLSVFILPVAWSYWRHNERQRAADTEETLQSLGFDTSHQHEMDIL